MRQEVPVCGVCKQARDEEVATRKAMKAKIKGKGKANAWDGDDEDEYDDDDEGWGYGEPGIMKVSS